MGCSASLFCDSVWFVRDCTLKKNVVFFIVLARRRATVISMTDYSGASILLRGKRLSLRTSIFPLLLWLLSATQLKNAGKMVHSAQVVPCAAWAGDKAKVFPSSRRRGQAVALLASIPPARETDFLLQETVTLWRV